jgi:hypothetical protein
MILDSFSKPRVAGHFEKREAMDAVLAASIARAYEASSSAGLINHLFMMLIDSMRSRNRSSRKKM